VKTLGENSLLTLLSRIIHWWFFVKVDFPWTIFHKMVILDGNSHGTSFLMVSATFPNGSSIMEKFCEVVRRSPKTWLPVFTQASILMIGVAERNTTTTWWCSWLQILSRKQENHAPFYATTKQRWARRVKR